MPGGISTQTLAKLASLYAGLAYGLYWIPLRALEEAGLHDVLPALMFNLVPMVLILPLIAWRWRQIVGCDNVKEVLALDQRRPENNRKEFTRCTCCMRGWT